MQGPQIRVQGPESRAQVPPHCLFVDGEDKMLLQQAALTAGAAQWWAADPKSAVVNFGVQNQIVATFRPGPGPPGVVKCPFCFP